MEGLLLLSFSIAFHGTQNIYISSDIASDMSLQIGLITSRAMIGLFKSDGSTKKYNLCALHS